MITFDKTPIIDAGVVIQGEASLAGRRHILIRVSGCNLRCKFKNSICDTPYSSYNPEKGKFDIEDVVKLIENDSASHIMITGGEVTLYPDFIKWMKKTFPKHHITVETNGTVFDKELCDYVDLWSISPKMLSSVDPEDSQKPYRETLIKNTAKNIAKYIEESFNCNGRSDVQLKYVVADEEDVLEAEKHLKEIESILKETVDRDWVYLMPAGSNKEELDKVRPIIGDLAVKYNFSLTDRIHINFWNDKREA